MASMFAVVVEICCHGNTVESVFCMFWKLVFVYTRSSEVKMTEGSKEEEETVSTEAERKEKLIDNERQTRY